MARPYWLDENGRPVDEGIPFAQHVRDYFYWMSLERMRAFRAELHYHGDAKAAKTCLGFGGCVCPCDHFVNDRVQDLALIESDASKILADLGILQGAVPVTPPLSPMGGNKRPNSIKNYTDQWRASNAS
jgi:hypothetical protein